MLNSDFNKLKRKFEENQNNNLNIINNPVINNQRVNERSDYDRKVYDNMGYDKNGYDSLGLDRWGYKKEDYDREGYNVEGYNHEGYNRKGYDREGYNREGYDREGYNREGYNRKGVNIFGLSLSKYINMLKEECQSKKHIIDLEIYPISLKVKSLSNGIPDNEIVEIYNTPLYNNKYYVHDSPYITLIKILKYFERPLKRFHSFYYELINLSLKCLYVFLKKHKIILPRNIKCYIFSFLFNDEYVKFENDTLSYSYSYSYSGIPFLVNKRNTRIAFEIQKEIY